MTHKKHCVSSAQRLPVRRGIRAASRISPWPLIMLGLLVAVAAGPLLFMEHKQESVLLDLGEPIVVHPLSQSAGQPKTKREDAGYIPDRHGAGCIPAAGPVSVQDCAGKAAYADTWDGYWTDFSGPGWSKEWAND